MSRLIDILPKTIETLFLEQYMRNSESFYLFEELDEFKPKRLPYLRYIVRQHRERQGPLLKLKQSLDNCGIILIDTVD